MTTIDYKQKIKDYMNSRDVDTLYKSMLNNLFPELKESEDEKIRQLLIRFVKYDMPDNYSDDFSKEECLAWLEKQSEQKPTDKIESKFKVGNWYQCTKDFFDKGVTFDKNTAYYCAKDGCLQNEYGCHIAIVKELCDNFKLWTIKDAKAGDVLADNVGVILFRKIGNEKDANVVDYHCAVFKSGSFLIQKGVSYWGYSKDEQLRPATKEQRERFFGAMRVAGYEWNADKKELKKIEQKPQSAWKPSDEQMKALEFYIKTYVDTEGCYGSEVLELYEQLKKLREE